MRFKGMLALFALAVLLLVACDTAPTSAPTTTDQHAVSLAVQPLDAAGGGSSGDNPVVAAFGDGKVLCTDGLIYYPVYTQSGWVFEYWCGLPDGLTLRDVRFIWEFEGLRLTQTNGAVYRRTQRAGPWVYIGIPPMGGAP